MKDIKMEKKLYLITFIDNYGEVNIVTITNDLNKWIKENNKDREEKESLNQFDIKEINAHIF